ncbi:hypothetical protein CR513_29687, partial [Mucuna pruriens]
MNNRILVMPKAIQYDCKVTSHPTGIWLPTERLECIQSWILSAKKLGGKPPAIEPPTLPKQTGNRGKGWRRDSRLFLQVREIYIRCVSITLVKPKCLMKNETLSINNEIHARTLWKKIESFYASKCGNNKLFLLNSIVSLKFKERTSLSDHLNEFQRIIDQMSRMCIKFEDKILGLLLLNSLPESWKTFKVFITNSVSNGVVSW